MAKSACDDAMNPAEIVKNVDKSQIRTKTKSHLSTRSDVINKGLVRSIKSYYLKKFKKMNQKIVRRRFSNVGTSECIKAWESFLKAEFEDDNVSVNYHKFAKFMLIFFNLKPMKSISFEKSIIAKGLQVQDWMRRYSYTKFLNLSQIYELKLLALKIKDLYLEEIFEARGSMNQNKELYKIALDELIKNFDI